MERRLQLSSTSDWRDFYGIDGVEGGFGIRPVSLRELRHACRDARTQGSVLMVTTSYPDSHLPGAARKVGCSRTSLGMRHRHHRRPDVDTNLDDQGAAADLGGQST